MLDIKFIRQNTDIVKKAAHNKGVDIDIDKLLEVDKKRREILQELESARAQQNKKSDKKPDKEELSELKNLKSKIHKLEEDLKETEKEFEKLMLRVPNIPADDVPIGKDENDNKVLRKEGKIPKFKFEPKDHVELGEKLDIIDIERAAKVSGTRFTYLKKEAVLLEFALINFVMDKLVKESFIPVVPPVLIKKNAMEGMGYLEHGGEEDMYVFEKDNLVLVGTSEQSMGPMHMNEFLAIDNLPLRYVGFSTCFRREAGSYGQDTRGIFRVHQFDKLEMFSFTLPEKSDEEHEFLLNIEEEIIKSLKIPYRVVKICAGDLGAPAVRKYDIEAWIPSQKRYREITSTSTTTDFQSRRLGIKYRYKNKNDFVHMLNGTGVAIGRTLIAILENYQQSDGSVKIPKALQKYMGGLKEIKPTP